MLKIMNNRLESISRISKYYFLIFLVIPLFPPEGLSVINPLIYAVIYKISKYIAMAIIMGLFVVRMLGRKLHFSIVYFLVVAFACCNIFITVVKAGNIKGCVSTYISALIFCLLFEIFDDHLGILINCLYAYLLLLTVINGICMIKYPGGMYIDSSITRYHSNWFLGYKSSFQYYFLPLMCLSLFKLENNRKYYIALVSILLIHLETLFARNMMLMVGLVIIDAYVIAYHVNKKWKINAYILTLGAIVANIIFLRFNKGSMTIASYIMENWLHKDIESVRVYMWKTTIKWIANSPFIGYGRVADEIRYGMYGKVNHTHNQILEILFQGGIVLLGFYLVLIFYVAYRLYKVRDSYTSFILSVSLFSLYIMVIVEIFTRPISSGIWLLFCLSTKIKPISKSKKYILNNRRGIS